MTTQSVTQTSPLKFLAQANVKEKFVEILGKKGVAFAASLLTLVNQNEKLKKCNAESIYTCAIVSATLDLPINPQLGFAYIIPYEDRQKGTWTASFQLGWRGFVQLALRSGEFKTIGASPIYKDQLISENPLTGFVFDFDKPKIGIPIGYAASFTLLNGFEKSWYMKTAEVEEHGKKYSKTYNSGPWKTDFESMATKTVLKLLLSKFAPLSVEMQKAIIADQAVIKDPDTDDVDYVDVPNNTQIEKGNASVAKVLKEAKGVVGETHDHGVLFTALNDCEVMDTSDKPVQVFQGDEVHTSKIPGVATIGLNYINLSQFEGNKNFILTV